MKKLFQSAFFGVFIMSGYTLALLLFDYRVPSWASAIGAALFLAFAILGGMIFDALKDREE